MSTIEKYILIICIVIPLVIILLMTTKPHCGAKEFENISLQMTLVNGEKIEETYKLGKGAQFRIVGSRQGYSLRYYTPKKYFYCINERQLRPAVIDYKILSRKAL